MRAHGSNSSGMSEVSPCVVSSFEADSSFWQAVDTAPCEGVSNFDISFFGYLCWSWSLIHCLPYCGGWGGVGLIMFMCACVTLGMLRCATVMYTCVTHGMLRSATLLPSLEATDLTLLRDWGGLCLSCGREGLILGSGVGQVIIPSS